MQQSGTTGGAEGLKGDSGDKAEELYGFASGGGRGRLGGTIHNEGDLVLDDEEDLELCLTSNDLELIQHIT